MPTKGAATRPIHPHSNRRSRDSEDREAGTRLQPKEPNIEEMLEVRQALYDKVEWVGIAHDLGEGGSRHGDARRAPSSFEC